MINLLIYASTILIIILVIYLIISFFPRLNARVNFFNTQTPLYEKVTFYVSTIVSVVSLIIALRTYNDALLASKNQDKVNDSTRIALEKVVVMIAKQTQTLETSRLALENVVGLSKNGVKLSSTQQKILDASLKVSKEELKTIKDKNAEERLNNSYKPDLQVFLNIDSLRYTEQNTVKEGKIDWFKIVLSKNLLNKKIPMKVGIVNKGKVSAKGTIVLITPLLPGSEGIEKVSGLNPLNDHYNNDLKVDIAEFYDYYSIELPAFKDNYIFNPEYKFNFLPTKNESAFKIDVNVSNGINKAFVVFIVLK